MKRMKRLLCALLAVLLLCSLAPQGAGAADTVYFTAVNDQLLPLNDETMPFWSGGLLYVAHTELFYSDLGISCSLSLDSQLVVLYKQRKVLMCELSTGTIYDNDDSSVYPGTAIVRGGVVFLPVETLCRAFNLTYSYNKIAYGYLVRVKNANVILSDTTFIDAAGSPMALRYAQYERAHTPTPAEPDPPSQTGDPPESTPQPAAPDPEPEPMQRTAYLAVEATNEADCAPVLTMLTTSRVTFLVTPGTARGEGDMVRRIVVSNHTLALHVDATQGAESALEQIEGGNAALWAAANRKTRMVYAEGMDKNTEAALREAGYCPIRFAVNYSAGLPTAARMTAGITAAADARGGRCNVLLGPDAAIKSTFSTLLNNLRTENCTMLRLTEVFT